MRRWSVSTFGSAIDPAHETAKFIDYWRAEGRRKKNWHAAWQKWMRDAADFAAKRATRHLHPVNNQQSREERGIY